MELFYLHSIALEVRVQDCINGSVVRFKSLMLEAPKPRLNETRVYRERRRPHPPEICTRRGPLQGVSKSIAVRFQHPAVCGVYKLNAKSQTKKMAVRLVFLCTVSKFMEPKDPFFF